MQEQEKDIYVAVDFGSNGLKAMMAKKTEDGRLDILGVENHSDAKKYVKRGVVENHSHLAFCLSSALKKMKNRDEMSNLQFTRFYTGVSGQSLTTRFFQQQKTFDVETEITAEVLSSVEKEMKVKIQTEENFEVLEIHFYSFLLDGQFVANPIGQICKTLQVCFFVVGNANQLKFRLQEVFPRIQLESTMYTLPFLLGHVALPNDAKEEGCVLIDFGAETISLTIFKDNQVCFCRVLPVGNNLLIKDLEKECNISTELAEKILYNHFSLEQNGQHVKLKIGERELSKTMIWKVVATRFDEFAELICKAIDEAKYWGKLPKGIFLTGGGSLLKGIDVVLDLKTNMDIHQLSFDTLLVDDVEEKYLSPKYANLYALLSVANKNCVGQPKSSIPQSTPKGKEKKTKLMDRLQTFIGDLFIGEYRG